MNTFKVLLAGFVLVLAAPQFASAGVEHFHAEIHPVEGTGGTATGQATFQLDADRGEVSFEVHVEGLSSPEIGAHIHDALGNLLYTLPPGEFKSGVWMGVGLGAVYQMRQEQLFIMFHTENIPGGEARGNVVAGKVAVDGTSVSELKQRY